MDPGWGSLGATGPMLGGKSGHIGSNWDQLEGTGTVLRGLRPQMGKLGSYWERLGPHFGQLPETGIMLEATGSNWERLGSF